MKRIDLIKQELCNKINHCEPDDFEKLLRGLEDSSSMYQIAIKYFKEFDNDFYNIQSDEEMAEIISSGEYDEKFLEWLEENV